MFPIIIKLNGYIDTFIQTCNLTRRCVKPYNHANEGV